MESELGNDLVPGSETLAKMLGERSNDDSVISSLTDLLATLVAHQVSPKRFAMPRFSRSGNFEPLLHSLMCFLLRHDFDRLSFSTLIQIGAGKLHFSRRNGEYSSSLPTDATDTARFRLRAPEKSDFAASTVNEVRVSTTFAADCPFPGVSRAWRYLPSCA